MPGMLRNKLIGVVLAALAVYYVATDPVGAGHAVAALVRNVVAFLHALSD